MPVSLKDDTHELVPPLAPLFPFHFHKIIPVIKKVGSTQLP